MSDSSSSPDSNSEPENELLVITALEGKRLSKTLDADLNKISGYDAGHKLQFSILQYTNLHNTLEGLFEAGEVAFLLSAPTDFLEAELEVGHCVHRRLLKPRPHEEDGTATVAYRDGVELSLDLDDVCIPDFDALNPEPGIKSWLAENNIYSDVTWQITASQQLNSEIARLRLYIQLDKPYSVADRKAYSAIVGADISVYTATQPNYIAPPHIEGGADPIPKRHGFIKGKNKYLTLPEVTEEQKKHYAPVLGNYKKSDSFPMEQAQVLLNEGKLFRRVLVPVTMSLSNHYPDDPDYILFKTMAMVDQMPVDKRRPNHGQPGVLQNIREMIDDGIRKVKWEQAERDTRAKSKKKLTHELNNEIRILPKYSIAELFSAIQKLDRTADDFADVIQNIAAILNSIDDYYPLYLMFMEWIKSDNPYKKFDDKQIRQLWDESIVDADPEIVKKGVYYIYDLAKDNSWEGIHGDIPSIEKHLKAELLQKRKRLTDIYGVAQVDGGGTVIISRAYNAGMGCWDTQFQTLNDLNTFYAQDNIWISVEDKNKTVLKKKSIVEVWSKSNNRKQYTSVVFDPMPGIIAGGSILPDGHQYNFYQGLAITPCEGEWGLIDWHIRNIICNGGKEKYEYFMNWCARMFQQPNKQGMVVPLLHSSAQGTGKNIIIDMLTKAFGQHGVMISDEKELIAQFNSRLAQTVCAFFNEAIWGGSKSALGKLKSMITDTHIAIELKHKDRITVKNCLHIIMASNNKTPANIENHDRRFCGFDVSDKKAGDTEYFNRLASQIKNGGCEAFVHYLLNRDISGFDVTDISDFQSNIKTQSKLNTADAETLWWVEVLGDGYVSDGSAMFSSENKIDENKLSSKVLHDSFLKWADKNKRNKGHLMTVRQLSKHIREEMCSGSCSRSSNIGKNHLKGIMFLSLDECRKSFESFFNEKINWDE